MGFLHTREGSGYLPKLICLSNIVYLYLYVLFRVLLCLFITSNVLQLLVSDYVHFTIPCELKSEALH